MKKFIVFFVSLLLLTINLSAAKITVTSSADPGAGTLREAITNANNGDTIVFANNVTTVYFTGMITIGENVTICGNETINTIFQNAPVWLFTGSSYKRYFQILPNAEVTFNHLTMKDNVGNCGGGAINNAGILILNHCVFSGNKAYDTSGAIMSSGSLTVRSCVFSNNVAPNGPGGAMTCRGVAATIINSLFVGNNSIGSSNGGAVYIQNDGVAVSISNCTFTENTSQGAGAIANLGTVTLCNNIIWNNGTNDIATNFGGTTIAMNNLIGTSNTNLSGNGNIIGVNPLFLGNGNYSLQETSPAIDNGNNAYLPAEITTDLAGNPRISNGIVDMGAYEFQNNSFVPVTNITGIPTTAIATLPLTLTSTVVPNNATNQAITWTVQSAGTTGATIATGSSILNTTSNGTCIVLATIVNGTSPTQNYMQQCTIAVSKATLTGTPTITGNAVWGQTLTAVTNSLSSSPPISDLGAKSYQWRRGTTDINDATAQTYLLVQADIGHEINVVVTAANCAGSVTSPNTPTVSKATPTPPAAPTLLSKTTTSITLNAIEGCEYRKDGEEWQASTFFSGLTPFTAYTFTQRKTETATHFISEPSAPATFTTDNNPTLTGIVTITGDAVFGQTLIVNTSGLTSTPVISDLGTLSYQWFRGATEINGATSSSYTLLQEDISQYISVKVKAANCDGSVSSEPTSAVSKAQQTPPEAPTLESSTKTSITLNVVSGCEYNISEGTYQSSPVFDGLMPSTPYTFTQRMAETATHLPSPASPSATFTTDITLYTIVSSVNNSAFGTITPYGENSVEEGGSIEFTITAYAGYKVESVMIDGVNYGARETYIFQNVQADGSIAVVFINDVGINACYNAGVRIYPNPTSGVLQLTTSNYPITKIEVFSTSGKDVQFNYIPISTYHYQVDISGLQTGIYIIGISTEHGKSSMNVVKQ